MMPLELLEQPTRAAVAAGLLLHRRRVAVQADKAVLASSSLNIKSPHQQPYLPLNPRKSG
jgi:hypothetical protein